jgi:acetyl-CoA carboxylase carboxyl transferase subunit alpha
MPRIDSPVCLPFERPVYEQLARVEEIADHIKILTDQAREARETAGTDPVAASTRGKDLDRKIAELESERRKEDEKCRRLTREVYSGLTPWERIQVARHPSRPYSRDYIEMAFTDVMELHGDRLSGDDGAILTALARLGNRRVMLVAQRKGRDTRERLASNFGMARPEGYRKAMAKMKVAERFGLPVVTLIDTPGAYPGIDAEERGQAWAIAESILEMCRLRVPIVAAVIGEGGSGGALAIGVADKVLILENAYYSVISPEGCASILWKSRERASEAARALRITGADLQRLGVVDEVVPEPLGGAHRDPKAMAAGLSAAILRALDELDGLPVADLLDTRYRKVREVGAQFFQTGE